MADITFPLGQNGSFASALANVEWQSTRLNVNNVLDDGTGAGDADPVYLDGVPIKNVMGEGVVKTATPAHGSAQISTITPGLTMRVTDFNLVKSWNLENATSAGDVNEAAWTWERPNLFGSIRGTVIAGGPVHDTQLINPLTMEADLVGEVTGQAKVQGVNVASNYRRGGRFRMSFGFIYTGGYTYEVSPANFAAILGEAVRDPIKDDITVDLDTGESITHSTLLRQFAVFANPNRGGAVRVRALFQFDKPTP